MELQKKRWIYKEQEIAEIEEFINTLNITKITAKILLNRDIKDVQKAKEFLMPQIKNLNDPFLLKDMKKAVDRIKKALENKESIWIYGDYDVDGVTSVALLIKYFNSISYTVNYYIPDRMEEGYGVNKDAIKEIADKGGKLIITVDCGITSVDEVKYAMELGIDIIITDHHHCHTTLPNAYAIINPKQKDCEYPFDKLCGCGVAFKVIQALMHPKEFAIKAQEYLDILAVATVADIVPLIEENRVFVKNGLEYIQKTKNFGMRALLEVCGLKNKKLNTSHIAFMLAPRINAAGRISSAKIGVNLLTTNDPKEAKKLAQLLDEENKNRQELEGQILVEALKILEEDPKYKNEKVLVLYKENWHHGVIGIVASRIMERYYKPTIILSIEGDIAKGSARSISGFDLFESLNQCKELLIKFGGHEQAAGLSINVYNLEIFREKINNIADKVLNEEDFIPEIFCDDKVNLKDINEKLIDDLEKLQPFGLGNSTPKLLHLKLIPKDVKTVGLDGKHLKMHVEGDNQRFDAIGFNLGIYKKYITLEDEIAMVFSPELNIYNGNKKIQLNIKDIKIMKSNQILQTEETIKYYRNLNVTKNLQDFKSISLQNIPIVLDNKKNETLLNLLQNEKKTLILVNTLQQSNNVIKLSEIREKAKQTSVKIFYNQTPCDCKDNEVHIVINPNIDKIEFKIYNSIIVYDMFFCWKDYYYLVAKNHNSKIRIFYTQGDENSNLQVLKSILPTRKNLITIYKLLKKYDRIPVEFNKLLKEIQDVSQVHINERLLKNAFEIFKEGHLIEYEIKNNHCYFSIHPATKKVNLEELNTFQEYKALMKNFINFISQWMDEIKGGNYNGSI